MTVALAIAILVVGLGMLGLAAGFGASAVRQTKAREVGRDHAPEPQRQNPAWPMPASSPGPRPESSRGLWIGAGVSALLGLGALTGAASVLIATMMTPDRAVTAPARAGGLQRDDSERTREVVQRQRQRLKEAGVPGPLAAVYRKPGDTETTVLFIGSSGHIDMPDSRLRELLRGIGETSGVGRQAPARYPAGPLKGSVMCLSDLSAGATSLAACGWADTSTFGVITTDTGDATQTAALLLSMRGDMEKKR